MLLGENLGPLILIPLTHLGKFKDPKLTLASQKLGSLVKQLS